MIGYVFRRLLYALFVIWGAFTVTFLLLYLLPSDPISLKLSQDGASGATGVFAQNPEVVAALKARYGFDQPLPTQYLFTLWRFINGDFGVSISTGIPVAETVRRALLPTFTLALTAIVLAVIIGGLVAIVATYSGSRRVRQIFLSFPSIGMSLPVFWVGLVLLQIFSFQLGWFPAMGNRGVGSIVLPAITLALPTSAVYAQVLAKSLFDALQQPYVQIARAKGLSRLQVHFAHALRNAIIPTLTLVGISVGNVLAGAVIVETVFSRVGIGRITHAAVNSQDVPVVLAVVVISAAAFATANLIVDLAYPLVDPRIRRAAA
ncbi:ABC transporter permease [Mesorhizobium sp. DCY119]|uniref:ABC transporter permease n=1 Tax=Mesorhizobium sp. DCY119 TaxID=2108445 RepID=UPI000E73A935|nr:ABC transporter permease [Mesorhizobium sp. DCY119]RJG40538.1 ABC transporter permease [Mesorhizobium sp. DCY119]